MSNSSSAAAVSNSPPNSHRPLVLQASRISQHTLVANHGQTQPRWKDRIDPQHLPYPIATFFGIREPAQLGEPVLRFLTRIPLKHEIWIFSFFGSFVGLSLVGLTMEKSQLFRGWDAPIIVGSFGAMAVLIYGSSESPLAQPRNAFGGQLISVVIGTLLTRLFKLVPEYDPSRPSSVVWVNGALCMSTALLAMQVMGCTHPPAGATALLAAVQPEVVALGFRFIPCVVVSSLIMLGWAMIVNNLGRRRYPQYWWTAAVTPGDHSKTAKEKLTTLSTKDRSTGADDLDRVELGVSLAS